MTRDEVYDFFISIETEYGLNSQDVAKTIDKIFFSFEEKEKEYKRVINEQQIKLNNILRIVA